MKNGRGGWIKDNNKDFRKSTLSPNRISTALRLSTEKGAKKSKKVVSRNKILDKESQLPHLLLNTSETAFHPTNFECRTLKISQFAPYFALSTKLPKKGMEREREKAQEIANVQKLEMSTTHEKRERKERIKLRALEFIIVIIIVSLRQSELLRISLTPMQCNVLRIYMDATNKEEERLNIITS